MSEAFNDWDGFDGNATIYNEKEEKSYQARIWWALFVVALLVIVRGVYGQIKEYRVVSVGNTIICDYNEETMQASYKDPEGRFRMYDISGYDPQYEGKQITLYYTDSIEFAIPKNTLWSWVKIYVMFGAALFFVSWRLYRIYKQ